VLALVGKASPNLKTGDVEFYLREFETELGRTGRFVYAWTFNPDETALTLLSDALGCGEDVYLYLPISGGLSSLRMHVVGFRHDAQSRGLACPREWIDRCITPLRDRSDFGPGSTETIHLWFLLDSIERLVPPIDLRTGFYSALPSKYAKWGQNCFAFLRPRTVSWMRNDDLDWRAVGHGLLFFASESTKSNDDLIAVVHGYGWLHERPQQIEVEIRPSSDSLTTEFLAAAESDIEALLLNPDNLPGLGNWISPRVFVHANA